MISQDWTIRLYFAIGCLTGAALPAGGQPQGVNYQVAMLSPEKPKTPLPANTESVPSAVIRNIWFRR